MYQFSYWCFLYLPFLALYVCQCHNHLGLKSVVRLVEERIFLQCLLNFFMFIYLIWNAMFSDLVWGTISIFFLSFFFSYSCFVHLFKLFDNFITVKFRLFKFLNIRLYLMNGKLWSYFIFLFEGWHKWLELVSYHHFFKPKKWKLSFTRTHLIKIVRISLIEDSLP